MKKIVATRMYSFDYFQDLFFKYYGKMGFEILVFCKKEDLITIKQKYANENVYFFELPEHQSPYVYEEEKMICNWICQQTLAFYEKHYSNDVSIILFADHDEFYENINTNTWISRVIFFEWYLPPDEAEITASEFLNLVISGKCKGQIMSLWNDPYYKESVLKISSHNINFFKKCVYSNGFHRILYNNEVIAMEKESICANHLKGIPFPLAKERINKIVNSIKKVDDWCSNHYLFEFNRFNSNYNKFYESLKSYHELLKYKQKRLKEFENEESFFEKTILKADYSATENVPSLFFKI